METQELRAKQGCRLHIQLRTCPWRSLLPSACSQPSPGLPLPRLALAFLILSISEALEELSRVRQASGSLSPVSPMSPATSPQGKGRRVWRALLLLLLLLPLLIPGEGEGKSAGKRGEGAMRTSGTVGCGASALCAGTAGGADAGVTLTCSLLSRLVGTTGGAASSPSGGADALCDVPVPPQGLALREEGLV